MTQTPDKRLLTEDRGYPAFKVPAPTGVGATDDANIRATITKARTAGGGRVVFDRGTYVLLAPLAFYPSVHYLGVEPTLQQTTTAVPGWAANFYWTFVAGSGTVLTDDGSRSYSCFEANVTDAGTTTAAGTTQINNGAVRHLGIDGFSYGLRCGAQNVMGLVHFDIDKVFIRNASQWGVKLVNYQELNVGQVVTSQCQNGQFWGSSFPGATFMPGNSRLGELFNLMSSGSRQSRGVVFSSEQTAGRNNENYVERVQSCGYNRALLSESVSLTSGNSTIPVADGTKYAVGMPVYFSTTANGFTTKQTYVVLSVSGNNITIGNTLTGAAVAPTGTASMTLNSYGFAFMEIIGTGSTTAGVQNSKFEQVDLEGTCAVALYVDGSPCNEVHLFDIPSTIGASAVVVRNSLSNMFFSAQAASTDVDSTSAATASWWGMRGVVIGRTGRGLWNSTANSTSEGSLSSGSGGLSDWQQRPGFNYPQLGWGERYEARDTAITLSGANTGVKPFSGSSPTTFTLPTITTDATPSASNLGCWFELVNVGTATLTVVTDGTQLFNKVAAKTSITVAAGAAVRINAVKDVAGTFFWYARTVTLA